MDLPRELVVTLVERLDVAVANTTATKDIMHFDLRAGAIRQRT